MAETACATGHVACGHGGACMDLPDLDDFQHGVKRQQFYCQSCPYASNGIFQCHPRVVAIRYVGSHVRSNDAAHSITDGDVV